PLRAEQARLRVGTRQRQAEDQEEADQDQEALTGARQDGAAVGGVAAVLPVSDIRRVLAVRWGGLAVGVLRRRGGPTVGRLTVRGLPVGRLSVRRLAVGRLSVRRLAVGRLTVRVARPGARP